MSTDEKSVAYTNHAKSEPGLERFLKMAMTAVPLGMLLGVWLEVSSGTSVEMETPILGGLVCFVICIFCWVIPSTMFHRLAGQCLQALMIGLLFGTIWGTFVYPSEARFEERLQRDDPGMAAFTRASTARNSVYEGLRREGLRLGMPVGAVAGIALGAGAHFWKRRSARQLACNP